MPTYNEHDNLRPVTQRLRKAVPEATVLIIDDASPDGTGLVADELATADSQVHVLHRPGKLGLGSAYLEGFRWAMERGFATVVEMDADGSHQPEDLPRLLAKLDQADLVIGSRWITGANVLGLSRKRAALSRIVQEYSRLLLRLPYRDLSGGYRAYRADSLRKIDLNRVQSTGFCFQVELTMRMTYAGMRIIEVPITFNERMSGKSKMSKSVILEGIVAVARWGFDRRINPDHWT